MLSENPISPENIDRSKKIKLLEEQLLKKHRAEEKKRLLSDSNKNINSIPAKKKD